MRVIFKKVKKELIWTKYSRLRHEKCQVNASDSDLDRKYYGTGPTVRYTVQYTAVLYNTVEIFRGQREYE